MAGDRTRIGLWRPQVGLERGRGGVHVHFAMHIAEADYDAAVAHLRAARPRRPRARVRHPPALPRGLRRRPRRPPRRALDLGRRRPPLTLGARQSKRSRSTRRRSARVASTSSRWTLIRLPPPPNFQPPLDATRRRRPSRPRPRRPCARRCRGCAIRRSTASTGRAVRRPRQPGRRAAAARPRGSPGRADPAASTVSVSRLAMLARVDARGTRSRAAPSRPNVYSTIHSCGRRRATAG